jgi:hypothetical protein
MTIARQHLVRRIDQAPGTPPADPLPYQAQPQVTGQAGPFLQLGFLELPVIPHLTVTGMGLMDVDQFAVLAA